jgi:hypothetical protein
VHLEIDLSLLKVSVIKVEELLPGIFKLDHSQIKKGKMIRYYFPFLSAEQKEIFNIKPSEFTSIELNDFTNLPDLFSENSPNSPNFPISPLKLLHSIKIPGKNENSDKNRDLQETESMFSLKRGSKSLELSYELHKIQMKGRTIGYALKLNLIPSSKEMSCRKFATTFYENKSQMEFKYLEKYNRYMPFVKGIILLLLSKIIN